MMLPKCFLPLCAALLLFAGCARELSFKTFRLDDSVRLEGMDATCEVSCAFDYVTGGVGEEVKDKINACIVAGHILFEEADGSSDVPAACRRWVEEQLGGFDVPEEAFDEDNSWMYQFRYSREGRFTTACKARHLQTYAVAYNDYTGGAHGMNALVCNVFDLTTGETVSEADLFAEGWQDGVSALLKTALDAFLEAQEEGEDLIFGAPAPNGNFSVSEEGVTWIYNPYEIAPYAMGSVELSVRWSDLKPYLK